MELIKVSVGCAMGLVLVVRGIYDIKNGKANGDWLVTFGALGILLQVFA